MIGRYLDRLSDVERDRVITAQSWKQFGSTSRTRFDPATSVGCLVQHASGSVVVVDRFDVACRFDEIVDRFGLNRVVRAIKLRAGKWTRPHIPEQLVVSPESSVGARQ